MLTKTINVEFSWTPEQMKPINPSSCSNVNTLALRYSCGRQPFHGSNRGSNPRGDAIQKSPQGSRLGGFLRKNPAFIVGTNSHKSTRDNTPGHVKPRLCAWHFVDFSWTVSRNLPSRA